MSAEHLEVETGGQSPPPGADAARAAERRLARARRARERARRRRAAGLAVALLALGVALSAPLLFNGDDFGQTDVIPAWRP